MYGINDLNNLKGSIISAIISPMTSKGNIYPIIRSFLKFLCVNDFVKTDFSVAIPMIKQKSKLPTTYTIDEIKKVEECIDTSTITGKRDKAVILLASRLGMRACDITNLEFDNLDFTNERINFTQVKTGVPLSLSMIPEIQSSLIAYINIRPKVDTNKVFLRLQAPYVAITSSAVRFALTCYFKKAGIDINNKKHGVGSLRSSLVSSMINDDIPYEFVRRVIGHTSKTAIKHYVRVDIEKLRQCSINTIKPTGKFKEFIEGDVIW